MDEESGDMSGAQDEEEKGVEDCIEDEEDEEMSAILEGMATLRPSVDSLRGFFLACDDSGVGLDCEARFRFASLAAFAWCAHNTSHTKGAETKAKKKEDQRGARQRGKEETERENRRTSKRMNERKGQSGG